MAAALPVIPRVIFTILEPISLVAGFLAPLISPEFFISSQLPESSPLKPAKHSVDPTSTLLAWQLGNTYLLLGLVGLFILNTTSEIKVVRAYLWALWIGDIGHVGFTLYAMGWDASMDVEKWNPVMWGNIAATAFLFLTRCIYLSGLFEGRSRSKTALKKSKGRGVGKKKR